MDSDLTGIFDDLTQSLNEFSTSFSETAKQFNSDFANIFGCGPKPKVEEITTSDNHMRTTVGLNTNYSIQERVLTPAICSCCGGRIGKNNYCEFCGTRYW